jgi:hypothetical protein
MTSSTIATMHCGKGGKPARLNEIRLPRGNTSSLLQCEEQDRESRVQDDEIKDLLDEIRGLKQNISQADTCLSIDDSLSLIYAEGEEDSNHDKS